jgi:hypothetical protein
MKLMEEMDMTDDHAGDIGRDTLAMMRRVAYDDFSHARSVYVAVPRNVLDVYLDSYELMGGVTAGLNQSGSGDAAEILVAGEENSGALAASGPTPHPIMELVSSGADEELTKSELESLVKYATGALKTKLGNIGNVSRPA